MKTFLRALASLRGWEEIWVTDSRKFDSVRAMYEYSPGGLIQKKQPSIGTKSTVQKRSLKTKRPRGWPLRCFDRLVVRCKKKSGEWHGIRNRPGVFWTDPTQIATIRNTKDTKPLSLPERTPVFFLLIHFVRFETEHLKVFTLRTLNRVKASRWANARR